MGVAPSVATSGTRPIAVMTRLLRWPPAVALLAGILINMTGTSSAQPEDTRRDVVSGNKGTTVPLSDPVLPAPSAPGPTVTVQVSEYVDGTGTQDVTGPLVDLLRRVPDGARIIFAARARYRVEGTIQLVNRSRIILDGNGAQFVATERGDGNRAHWRIVGGSDIVLRRMVVRGPNPDGGKSTAFRDDLQWQHGIDIRGSRRVLIDEVAVSDVYGDCVYVGGGSTGAWAEDIQIRAHDCRRNGRQGIAVTAARRVLVEDSRLGQIGLMTVDLEPNSSWTGVTDVTIRDNRIGAGPRQQFLGISGKGPVARVMVQRNVLVNKALTVLVAAEYQPTASIAVLANRSDTAYKEPGGAAMVFQHVHGLWVQGNLVPLTGYNMALLALKCTTDVTIVGNAYPGGLSQVRGAARECG